MYESAEFCIIGYWSSNDMEDVRAVIYKYGTDLHKYWYSYEEEAELGFVIHRREELQARDTDISSPWTWTLHWPRVQ
jgi:hypothetical protein